jgi:hypothetical protein
MSYDIFAPLDAWIYAHRVFLLLLGFATPWLIHVYMQRIVKPREKLEERLRWHERLHGAAEERIRALELLVAEACHGGESR